MVQLVMEKTAELSIVTVSKLKILPSKLSTSVKLFCPNLVSGTFQPFGWKSIFENISDKKCKQMTSCSD